MLRGLLASLALLAVHDLPRAQGCSVTIVGTASGDDFGITLAAIGDVDGDLVCDLAVGAPRSSTNLPGYVRVLSGSNGTTLGTINGLQNGDEFGATLAALVDSDGDGLPDRPGDVDGDSVPDFLVGAPQFGGGVGRAYVISGRTLTVLTTITNPVTTSNAWFGFSLTSCGNCTGDSRPEFAIGAPGWSAAGGGTGGRMYVYGWSGIGTATVASQLSVVSGAASAGGTRLGYRVRGVGDTDGNGIPDLLVTLDGPQAVRLYDCGGTTLTLLATITTPTGLSNTFGWTLAGLGNLDLVGGNEFAIGSPECGTGSCTRSGFVQIRSFAGGAPVLLRTLGPTMTYNPAVRFGASIAGIGLLDADPRPDIAIGIPGADPVGTAGTADAGEVQLWGGNALLGNSSGRLLSLIGDSMHGLGSALCGLGDTNGDGSPDFAIAGTGSGTTPGRVVIVRHAQQNVMTGVGCAPPLAVIPELVVGAAGGPCQGDLDRLVLQQVDENSLCLLAVGPLSPPWLNFVRSGCTLHVSPLLIVSGSFGPVRFSKVDYAVPNGLPPGVALTWQWALLGANYPTTFAMSSALTQTFR